MNRHIDTVMFDLDGTLLDTAPDFVHVLNHMRAERDDAPVTLAEVRPVVSRGASAMLKVAFPAATDTELPALRDRFLALYANSLKRDTVLFPGMDALLDALDASGRRWGIVTNKPGWLTGPLLAAFGLDVRAACVVSGDTLPTRKPDPAPLLHACALVSVAPAATVYVGDAENDIRAGRGGGLATALALFGYIDEHDDIDAWGADVQLEAPGLLLDWLGSGAAQMRQA